MTPRVSIRGLVLKIFLSLLAGIWIAGSILCLMAIANPALADHRLYFFFCMMAMGLGLGQLLKLGMYWVMGELG